MDVPSSDIVGVIYQLLPGFISAWIFFGLTTYLKPSAFERVVQALIFTVIVTIITIGVREGLLLLGRYAALGTWDNESQLIWSVLVAVPFGLMLSWCANNDFPCRLLRKDGENSLKGMSLRVNRILSRFSFTNKASHPTQWFSFFSGVERFSVLHLTGERRLYGWIIQFPDDPASGHFIVTEPEWLLDTGDRVNLHSVEQVLVNVRDVEWVEMLKSPDEVALSMDEQTRDYKKIYQLYEKGEQQNVDKSSKGAAS